MKKIAKYAFASSLFVLAGCGGGGGPEPKTVPVDTAGLVKAGTQHLDAALSGTAVSQSDVDAAYTSFSQAYQQDPNNPRAALGYALTEAVHAAANSAGVFVSSLFPTATTNVSQLALLKQAPQRIPEITSVGQAMPIGWQLARTSDTRLVGTLLPSSLRNILIGLEPAMTNIINALSDAHLAALETNPMVVKMYYNGSITDVRIGKAEGLVLRGAAKGLLGAINLTVAYNLDYGTWNWGTDTIKPLGAAGGTLTTTNFIPGGTFGKLTTTGQASMTAFGTNSVAGLNDEIAAIDTQTARSASNYWLLGVESTPSSLSSDKTNAQLAINVLTTARSLTFTPAGATKAIAVKVNMAPWLTGKAPADLRSLFSSLKVTVGSQSTTVAPVVGSITDPKFGGLFPNGLSSTVLYTRTLTLPKGGTLSRADAAAFAGTFLSTINGIK